MPFSLDQFKKDHDTEIFPVKIGQIALRFHKPKRIDPYIDQDDMMQGFPMWAKLWEASAVLVQRMADLPVDHKRSILELGSGLGVAGIAAAAMGHNVTLTEYDDNALAYLQANAVLNNCDTAVIRRLDWFQPDLDGTFDLIIGSELVYKEEAVDALGAIFDKCLHPQGKVILAERVRSTGAVFFERMAQRFDIRTRKKILRSKKNTETVVLFELMQKA